MTTKTNRKREVNKVAPVPKKRPTVGARIMEGLEEAIAWTPGQNDFRAR